jgi:hypothetical protein
MNKLFKVALIVEAVFGIGFLIAPGAMLGPFGVTLNAIATSFVRLFGSALISFSILLWFAFKSDNSEFGKGVVYSMFVYFLVSTVLLVIAQLAGQMNALGWSVVSIHVVFLVWFGYFLVK